MKLKGIISLPENKSVDLDLPDIPALFFSEAVNAEDMLLFPGLINSHDHLDFNCYPSLRSGYYNNYLEWGNSIHKEFNSILENVKQIPFKQRFEWGLYKNLLNGITTVVDHGNSSSSGDEIIDVWTNKHDIHSVGFEKNWKFKLNNILRRYETVVIHVGEGKDQKMTEEINALVKWNLLKRQIVGVHALSMNETQASLFKAVVWCPGSNDFLFGSQPGLKKLKTKTRVLFGTDSTLTGSWSIWDHLRLARETQLMNDEELFDSVTKSAAHVWGIDKINENPRDLVIAKKKTSQGKWDAFYSIRPEDILLVLMNDKIRLIDQSFCKSFQADQNQFDEISIRGSVKYIVKGIHKLTEAIRDVYPEMCFPFETDTMSTVTYA